jgi:hypothetical protein
MLNKKLNAGLVAAAGAGMFSSVAAPTFKNDALVRPKKTAYPRRVLHAINGLRRLRVLEGAVGRKAAKKWRRARLDAQREAMGLA